MTCAIIAVAGCTPDGTTEIDPLVVDPTPAVENAPPADPNAEEVSYHGRTINQWRQRAADREAEVRREAIENLGEIAQQGHHEEILLDLVAALGDRQRQVVSQASRSLEQLMPHSLPALIDGLEADDVELRVEVALAIEQIGPAAEPAVPALIRALDDNDHAVRENASSALIQIGGNAVAALGSALSHETPRVREQAARTLRRMGPAAKGAVPALLTALQDDDPDVHSAVASALFLVDRQAAEGAGIK